MSATSFLLSATPLRLSMSGVTVAIPILAVNELDDVALGGLLVAASLGPSVVAAPLVGALLDRTHHPRTMICAAGLVAVLGLTGGALLGILPTALVVIGLVATGAVVPFFQGGMSSFVTDVIPGERRGYAIDALSYNLSSVGGPSIVAVTAAFGSARLSMALLIASAILGVVGTAMTKLRPRERPNRSILRTIGAGLHHITTHRPILIVVTSGAITQLGAGALPVTSVLLALDRTGSADGGAMIMSVYALGGLIGAIATAARPRGRLRPELSMALGFAGVGLLTFGAAIDWGVIWTMVILGLAGGFTAPSLAAMLMLRKQQSPRALRGQVFTVAAGVRSTVSACGAAVAGLAAGVGGTVLILGIGFVWVVSALLLLAYPRDAAPIDD